MTLTFVLAHNILYTYIAPFLAPFGLVDRVDAVLLVFGVVSLLSIWLTGVHIDRHLRPLMIASCALFALATLALGVFAALPWLVFASAAVWGLAFGGAATLLQTASAEAAGAAGDVAQSLLEHRYRQRRYRRRCPAQQRRPFFAAVGGARSFDRCADHRRGGASTRVPRFRAATRSGGAGVNESTAIARRGRRLG
ncbi:hypothetical protein [Micromonospora sp. CPCC 206060]|uniref:hypothetical protein n=1 Tax=Micromonospora sp. CPCC 206060 TaxID=3122406 RepID=UPI002FEEF256